jgi:hypothetical protein
MTELSFEDQDIPIGLPWTPFCAVLNKKHLPETIYCLNCGVGRTAAEATELIPLDSSPTAPLPLRSPILTDTPLIHRPLAPPSRTTNPAGRIANLEREVQNVRIKNAQLARPHAGSIAMSTRTQVIARTNPNPPWNISVVLLKERFSYDSLEDKEDDVRSHIDRKYIGIYSFIYICLSYDN